MDHVTVRSLKIKDDKVVGVVYRRDNADGEDLELEDFDTLALAVGRHSNWLSW
jgi:hypothetical protein